MMWNRGGHPDDGVEVICYWNGSQPSTCYCEGGHWYYDDDNAYERIEIDEPDYWIDKPYDK